MSISSTATAELPYRSLHFEHQTHDARLSAGGRWSIIPTSTPIRGVTEFKYLTGQEHARTSIVFEYPRSEGDPYYPIPKPENAAAVSALQGAWLTRFRTCTLWEGSELISTTTWTRLWVRRLRFLKSSKPALSHRAYFKDGGDDAGREWPGGTKRRTELRRDRCDRSRAKRPKVLMEDIESTLISLHAASIVSRIQIWGGVECTYNRVARYVTSTRWISPDIAGVISDLELFASLGIEGCGSALLWERDDWAALPEMARTQRLQHLQDIAHAADRRTASSRQRAAPHEPARSRVARRSLHDTPDQVAERYPLLDAYTPVNEPHTTARFSGMYGIWYPHHQSQRRAILRALLHASEGHGTQHEGDSTRAPRCSARSRRKMRAQSRARRSFVPCGSC